MDQCGKGLSISQVTASVVSLSRTESQNSRDTLILYRKDTTGRQEMVNETRLPPLRYTFVTLDNPSVQLQTALILKSLRMKKERDSSVV